jgi:glycosyltransferase involved in cell wall biosynthesis
MVPKAARVISTKTFQFMAMRKPTIIADNPATRELFVSGENAYMVPMGDSEALANAIKVLIEDNDINQKIADGGYQLLNQRLSTEAIADDLNLFIKQLRLL